MTFVHDWFTRIGQGAGAEYRYVASQNSYGNVRVYRLDQHQAEFRQNGQVTRLPDQSSYQVTAAGNQMLGTSVRTAAHRLRHQRRGAAALPAESLPGIQCHANY